MYTCINKYIHIYIIIYTYKIYEIVRLMIFKYYIHYQLLKYNIIIKKMYNI